MITQDYSAWLTPERLALEEAQWKEGGIYQLYAAELIKVATAEGCRSVIEIGCGTGWVPICLPYRLEYTGVDANADCLALAREKAPRRFLNADIRGLVYPRQDMVCSFAVLKHFALAEWEDIVGRLLSFGRVGLFTMNVGDADADDFSQEFAHTWVSPHTLAAAVGNAGHQVVEMEVLHTGETMVRTCTREEDRSWLPK